MTIQSPLIRRDKIRLIIAAMKEARAVMSGNDGGELLKELGKEWLRLSREYVNKTDEQLMTGLDYSSHIYVIDQKQETILRLIEEIGVINFKLSLIRNIVYTSELCTYDLIKQTLYAFIDISKGQSRAKALAAYKASLASEFSAFGYSKKQSEEKAGRISWAIFEDNKGVNYPRTSETYKSKFISYHIISLK